MADNNKELLKEVGTVNTRVSNLKDEVASLKNEMEIFKRNVSKDLTKIVEFLGKQRNK
jgi:hypothetical protein